MMFPPIKIWFLLLFSLMCCLSALGQNNTLQYYQEQATRNSPLLKDYQNQVASTQLDSLRIKAVYKPQVALNSSGLFAPVIYGYGYSGAITNVQSFNSVVSVNKSLDSKRYIKAQLRTLVLQADSINNTRKISQQDLNRMVIGQYITAYGSLQQVEFNEQVNQLLTKEENILKKLTQQNVYRQTDYLTFLVTLQQQNLQLSQSRIQFQNDFATLNYLSGIEDTTTVKLQNPEIQVNYQPLSISNSIFFRQYTLDSVRLVNSRSLIDFSYRPRANIFADGGYNTGFVPPLLNNFGTSVGFTFTLPIYNGGQRKLQYKMLNLREETRKNYLAFFTKQYHQQIAQLQQQISGNESLVKQITEQLKYSERLIKVDFELMQTGDLRVSDLVLAINNYLTGRNQLTLNQINGLQLINQLNYWKK